MDPTVHRAAGSTPGVATAGSTALKIRFWGTRGSIPSPGPETARFGGNTPCVELRAGERRIIFDAGSGVRQLGHEIAQERQPLDGTLFLSHFHWDHIQGFPFFAPLYDAATRLRVVAPMQDGEDVRRLLAGQVAPSYFPVPFTSISAQLEFHHLNAGTLERDGFRVTALRMRHASWAVGYRAELAGAVVTYVPDNELNGAGHEVSEDWPERMETFVRGSDVLIHDAMYTEEEYRDRRGWGHSTHRQALDLALRTGVGRLVFFHHAPDRTDGELTGIVEEVRELAVRRGATLSLEAAAEGQEIEVAARRSDR